jgi:hypothetical protein
MYKILSIEEYNIERRLLIMKNNDKEKNNLENPSKDSVNTMLAYGSTGLGLSIIGDGANESKLGKEVKNKENKR